MGVTKTPSSRHSILVVGCGSIGERHLRCFLRTERAEVIACDTNPTLLAAMAEKYRVNTTESWEPVLNQVEAVVICTPAPFHVPMALKALAAGVHVLIEKPLSHSWEKVGQLLQASKQGPSQVAVAYIMRVYPFLQQARECVRGGELGPIRQVVMSSGQPFYRLRPAYAQTYYRDHRMGGGAIQDALTHSVNWVESVIGPTDSVFCDCAHQVIPGVEVEDTVHITARSEDGILVSYALNQFQLPSENVITFNAAGGSVRVEMHRKRWGLWKEGDCDWTWRETPVPDQDSYFTAQAHAFMDQMEGKPSSLCSLEAAAQTLRFNLSALASAESGIRVRCRDVHG